MTYDDGRPLEFAAAALIAAAVALLFLIVLALLIGLDILADPYGLDAIRAKGAGR